MLLQNLAALVSRPHAPPIGLELRPEGFALVHAQKTAAGAPLILGHASHALPPDDSDTAAAALNDAWSRLALPGRQASVSLPCPPARFVVAAGAPSADFAAKMAAPVCVSLALPGKPARSLQACAPASVVDATLALLERAGLAAARLQVDVLALLTACSHTSMWADATRPTGMLIRSAGDDYHWYALATADGLPQDGGSATDRAGLTEALNARRPQRIFLAGNPARIQSLVRELPAILPDAQICANPFAGMRLANEEDRRALTSDAPQLAVALGLALEAWR